MQQLGVEFTSELRDWIEIEGRRYLTIYLEDISVLAVKSRVKIIVVMAAVVVVEVVEVVVVVVVVVVAMLVMVVE